jgi:hypothetical protein
MAKGEREGWDPLPNQRLQTYLLTHPEGKKQLNEFLGKGLTGLDQSRKEVKTCDDPEVLRLYAAVIGEEIRRDSASAPIQRARLQRVTEGLAEHGVALNPELRRYL